MNKISLETIINFKSKVKEILKAFFKSEGFKIGAIIFICLFAIVITFPFFLDNSKLKFDLTQRLSKLTQSTISIKGDVNISLLPYPSISANNVFIENYALPNKRGESDNFYNIYVENLKIIFPIFRTNSRQLIKKIIADNAIIEIAQPEILKTIENGNFSKALEEFSKNPPSPEKNLASNSGLSSKLFPMADIESVTLGLSMIPSIQLHDSKIIFYNEYGISREIIKIDSNITYNQDIISGSGSFVSQAIENDFTIFAKFNSKKQEKNESFFSLSSPAFNMKINGNFLEKNLNGLLKTKFNGLFECEILELRNFYKSIISNGDLFSSKLRYNGKTIKLSSEIDNDGKNIDLKKININSDLINGIGDIYLGLSDKILTADINLDLEDLNIDEIWSTENPAKKIALQKEKNKLIENAKINAEEVVEKKEEEKKVVLKSPILKIKKRNVSDLILEARDYDINLEILIKNAHLYDGKVEDIKLYANIANDGKALLSPLSFKLPGNSEFRASGVFEESEMNSKFIGNVDGKGNSLNEVFKWLQLDSNNFKMDNLKNYSFYSDIEVSPSNTILKNFYVNLDDKKTEFYGNVELTDNEKSRFVNSNIRVSEFDFEKYISIPKNNIYLSEGILFDKLLWLNQIYSDYSIKLNFDKLLYQNQEFNNQNIVLNFGQGYFKIPKTHFASAQNIFYFEFNVDISDKNQIGNFILNADKLKLKLREDEDDEINPHSVSLFDKFYKLPSLQGFTGNIDITAKEINLDDKLIADFDYKNSIKNGIFGQSKLSMKIYDGVFEYKGLSDIKYNKIINGLFSCKSCNLNKILDDFYNVKAIDGIANLSGNIVSIAKSVDEFKSKIDSDINVAISSPKISGYGLKDLVTKMFSVKEFANELAEPEKILENKESSTQFLQGKGFVRLRGEKNSNFSLSFSGPAMNSIFSGIIFLKDESINGTLNTIFLSGSSDKKIPINIATNVVGFFDDVGYVSNLNQARQYLGLERVNNQELNTKLLAQSEEKKVAKKNKINKKSLIKKKKESSDSEEEVTIENQIIEETQIIEVNKPADLKIGVDKQSSTIIKNEDVKNINEVAKNISDESTTTTTTSTKTSNTKIETNENNSVKKENITQENKTTESQDSKVVQPSF